MSFKGQNANVAHHKKPLLTWPKLHARGWFGPNRCILHKATSKSAIHLTLSCEFVVKLSIKCAATFNAKANMSEGGKFGIRQGSWIDHMILHPQ